MSKVAVLVDDHALFADSFAALLEKMGMFDEVHTLNDPKKRLNYFLRNSRKELYLFLDYYLGDQLGIEMINDARRINKNVKIIMVSSVTHGVAVRSIMAFQPNAFISKASGFDTVVECINCLNEDKFYYCPIITKCLKELQEEKEVWLSSREIEILRYFAQGFSVNETAEKFFLSKHTVVSHRRKMMKKTKTNTITELLSYVRKTGLIED